ncbi:SDR family NAD(P)-dependent oxidoreductase [Pseudonocardia spinosispora]|uniref:SDR family NAD(P)-dependent oxidoreductase n=1 Tax=Pseudonocardia spinosispora TaxID=103441 RepID=UPI000405F6BF|nr:SDR family oxidoreductase [Pseudonocardia spinosispora]
MDLGLKGLRALVTGSTKGIGRSVAEVFAAEGAEVAVCSRNAEDVDATVRSLNETGVRAIGRAVDVADAAALKAWVDDAATELGGLDIVVANVSALAIQENEENWHTTFEVDLMHAVRLVEAAKPHLERSEAGSIVTVASVSGREIDFTAGPYGSLKAALIHYTQGVAYQLADKGIRANTVSPGNTYFDGGIWQQTEQNNTELYTTQLGLNPTGRMATPEEVAKAVVFVASPAVRFMTGSHLLVDGALARGVQL